VSIIREGGPEVCPPDYKESDDRTFWIYFFLRFVGTVMLSGGVSMLDPIALTMIQKYGGEFGRERLFSTIGMAIFSPLAGLLMDRSSRQLSEYFPVQLSSSLQLHMFLLIPAFPATLKQVYNFSY
jgi:hypothetical protein